MLVKLPGRMGLQPIRQAPSAMKQMVETTTNNAPIIFCPYAAIPEKQPLLGGTGPKARMKPA